jgi:glycosyltransferase involved in cell wall biosynthesis
MWFKNPKVSVVMPVYNAEKYIAETIESILSQTFEDFEFIIVNDCSTDKTREIIEKYAKQDRRIRLINNEVNLKVSKAANKGVELAKGEYIARTDSDDWSYPYRLEKQVKYMDKHPEVVLSSGNMEMCDENMKVKNRTHFPTTHKEIMNVLLQFNPMVHSAMIYRRDTFLEIGGYGGINTSEDYLLTMKMASKGKLGNLEDILVKYRVVDTGLTAKSPMDMHLATLYCALDGHLNYKYPITFKTKVITSMRLFIAYFVPAPLWRFISTVLRK